MLFSISLSAKLIVLLAVTLIAFVERASAADPGYKPLLNVSRFIIYKNGKSREVVDLRYEVLTEAGATELSNYRLRFPFADSRFRLLKAITETDGKSYEAKREDVRINIKPDGAGGVFEVNDVVIPLMQVKPGSLVQIKYQIDREALIEGVFGMQGGIANNLIAGEEIQIFNSEVPLKIFTRDFDDFFTLTEKKLAGRYQVEIQPTQKARMFSGKQFKVGLYSISTANSWRQVNQLLSARYERAIKAPLPEEFSKIVSEAAALPEKAKVEHATDRLRGLITYSGNWSTVLGRYYPSGHQEVVTQAKGDCKDFAVSLVAILRRMGLRAHVALTLRTENYLSDTVLSDLKEVPTLSPFNHAIVLVKDKAGTDWWVDPTSGKLGVPNLPSDVRGNLALVLDAKANGLVVLPNRNPDPMNVKIEQTISISPDSAVESLLQVQLARGSLSAIEGRFGPEVFAQRLLRIINPVTKGTAKLTRLPGGDHLNFSGKITAGDWVQEDPSKGEFVEVYHPIASLLVQNRRGGMIDFRDEGTIEFRTKILLRKAIDPVENECYVRSRWIELDRIVHNLTEGLASPAGPQKLILIEDRLHVKERRIQRAVQETEEFAMMIEAIKACAQKFRMMTKAGTAKKKDSLNLIKDSAVEALTDADIEKLESNPDLELRPYVMAKLLKYYNHRIKLNPKDSLLLGKRGLVKRDWGYVRGEIYIEAYLLEALEDINKGLALATVEQQGMLLLNKTKVLIDLKRFNEASDAFNQIQEKNTFDSYYVGYRLSRALGAYEHAGKWLALSEKAIATPSEKRKFHAQMAQVLVDQKKLDEAIKHYETLLKLDNVNAWDYHNAASIYFLLRDYEKCIEYEKKALALHDFALARRLLADALVARALNADSAMTAEGFFLEAIKWDGIHIAALENLAKLYLARSRESGNRAWLEKGVAYLDKALSVAAHKPELISLKESFEKEFTKGQ